MRNRDPIWAVLERTLPPRGLVLEIASGSGEHVRHFAAMSPPDLMFQPTDADAAARASIDSWAALTELANIAPAIALDAGDPQWPVTAADAVICINMIHIAPWSAAQGLVQGAARILPAGGLLYLYGPFRRDGQHTSPGNSEFDAALQAQNPAWGVRDLEAVAALAQAHGFASPLIEDMPANNLSVLFHRLPDRSGSH